MSVPVCPKDNILVTIDKKYMDATGTGLLIDPSWRPGIYATVTGKVVSVPLGMSDHPQKKVIQMNVKEGDDLAFAYNVIYSQTAIDNAGDIFYEDPPVEPSITSWSNGKGEKMVRRNKMGGKWDAAKYIIKDGKANILDRIDGNHRQINDFIFRHLNEHNCDIRYDNHIWAGEQDLWKVDVQQAFIARRGNKLIMFGGYVLLEHRSVEKNDYTGKLELFGDGRREIKPELRTKVLAIGEPLKNQPRLSVNEGDTVVVDQRTVQEYNFWGIDFLLARQDQILAKV